MIGVSLVLAAAPLHPSSPHPPTTPLPLFRRHWRCSATAAAKRFDSNAESLRYQDETSDRKTRRRKWLSEDSPEFDHVSDLFDDDDDGGDDIGDSLLDSIWILKVFQSYGWMLPAIIISILFASGPKAFLMALALPLGQSAISFAVDKVWGMTSGAPKRTTKAKKKPFARAPRNVAREARVSNGYAEERSGFQSWVDASDDVIKKDVGYRRPSFGGWDDLDRRSESKNGPARQPSQTKGRPPLPTLEKKGKLSQASRSRGVPLLIRLLIAVFPFLGSWTRLL